MKKLLLAAALFALPAAVVASCGGSTSPDTDVHAGADGARDRVTPDVHVTIDAGCGLVQIDSHELLPSPHVAQGSTLTYNSNPPSSGPHFPFWAAFRKYDTPVPRGFYVHSLEHGAIVLAYKCDVDSGVPCADVVSALEEVARSIPNDKLCTPEVRARVIITPDPLLDVPIAAAAWGWTYRATCVDLPSLKAFAGEHYARADEDICVDGTTSF